MKLAPQTDGRVHLTEGPDRLVLSHESYEDLRCALPLDNASLFAFLDETVLEEADDRTALARIVAALGGIEPAMTALQELLGEPPAAAMPAAESPREEKVGVLFVEPDDWNARTMEEALRDSPFVHAGRVRRIEEGLERYRKNRPALVVLNLTTPGAEDVTVGGGLGPVRSFLDIDRECRLLATYTFRTKTLLMAAIRAGASGHLLLPAERKDLLYALTKALTARTATPAPRGIVVKRNLVCRWKADSAGMLAGWNEFLARSIDLKGIDGPLNVKLKEGEGVRLRIELPGEAKPVETQALVAVFKWDPAVRTGAVRFAYKQLSVEALARLSRFLTAEQAKPSTRRR